MLAARALAATCRTAADGVLSAREMSVRIRLARFGRKKRPFYRIRVADSRSPRDGKFLENVGTYDPLPSRKDNMKEVRLDRERIEYWLSVGAQPSDTVKRILGNAGILPEYVHPLSVESAVPRADRPKKVRKKKKKKQ